MRLLLIDTMIVTGFLFTPNIPFMKKTKRIAPFFGLQDRMPGKSRHSSFCSHIWINMFYQLYLLFFWASSTVYYPHGGPVAYAPNANFPRLCLCWRV